MPKLKLTFKNSNNLITLSKLICIFHSVHYNVVMPEFTCTIKMIDFSFFTVIFLMYLNKIV